MTSNIGKTPNERFVIAGVLIFFLEKLLKNQRTIYDKS